MGGEPFKYHGNTANTGLITNLPPDCCVEVPVYADKGGLHAIHVGALPASVAPLNQITVASEELAVEAALTGDPTLVFQAVAYAPLTASMLSLAEIKKMVNEMLAQNKDHLPTFKHFEA